MNRINTWLNDYPSTNARLFTSVCLDVVFVATALFCMVRKIEVDSNIIWSLGTFLLVLSGLDATQYTMKRKTEIITPPQTTAEHAVATTVVTAPVAPSAPTTAAAAIDVANQLAQETQAKAARQAGTSFEGG